MDLHLTSCIIFISSICILQTSQLPIDNRLTSNISDNDNNEQIKAFYYPSINQREVMKSSASSYYTDDDDYSDYGTGTLAPSLESFESEKINKKTSDIKKLSLSHISNNASGSDVKDVIGSSKLNSTQLPSFTTSTSTNLEDNKSDSTSKFQKLLFSSPSATVTSNGPSGPFKAIICHDCENSGGVNAGHYSVSFSAIKSWNVGSSAKSNFSEFPSPNPEKLPVDPTVEQTSKKYVEINQNLPDIMNSQTQGSDAEVTVIDSTQSQQTPPASLNNKNEWNYSLLTVRNENINVNSHSRDPPTTTAIASSSSPTRPSTSNQPTVISTITQKKPIFNDLLKVPYDILNAPLSEPAAASEPIKNTQIHINHQQKINDTITNYQHFQQFVQKNPQQASSPAPKSLGHYQSTPMPEQNYEVDETVSLMTNGRAHGVQSTTPKLSPSTDNEKNFQPTIHAQVNVDGQDAKFGVVFEGRDFRKYKVEEKTADGFIVGEYGYLSNTDGSPLFGVRYTADSNINPQLIYDALLKFIKL